MSTDGSDAAGDADAEFEALFAEHHPHLVRLAIMVGGDVLVAEDAVAEVFARVLRRWPVFRPDDPAAYLRRAVLNELVSASRRRRTRTRWTPDARPDVAEDETVLRRQVLWDALNELSGQQRAAVVLRFVDDLPEAATAAALGVPVGTVKSSVARALARLRMVLNEDEV